MSLLTDLVRRFRGLFRDGREDAETREELRFHLEMETEKNERAGMDSREARRRARLRLGGLEAVDPRTPTRGPAGYICRFLPPAAAEREARPAPDAAGLDAKATRATGLRKWDVLPRIDN